MATDRHQFLVEVEDVLANLVIVIFASLKRLYDEITIRKILLLLSLFFCYIVARELRLIILNAEYGIGIGMTDAMIGLDDVLNAVSSVLSKGASVVSTIVTFGRHSHANIPKLNLIDKMPFLADMVNIKHTCDESDSISTELLWIVKITFNNNLCAFVRYMYPLTLVYFVFDGVLGFLIFNPDPTTQTHGCHVPSDLDQCIYANCYRVFEFMFFAMIAFVLFVSAKPLLKYVLIDGIWKPFHNAVEQMYRELHTQIDKIFAPSSTEIKKDAV